MFMSTTLKVQFTNKSQSKSQWWFPSKHSCKAQNQFKVQQGPADQQYNITVTTPPQSTTAFDAKSTQQIDVENQSKLDSNKPIIESPKSPGNDKTNEFSTLQLTGPPRVSSPILPNRSPSTSRSLPLMLYIPGIDGTGFAARQQFKNLINDFDLKCLTVPQGDRTSFIDLVAFVKEYLIHEASENPVQRPIYLLGESFGGLLAMAVALECNDLVDRLILVNPASSYLRTLWPIVAPIFSLIPPEIYNQLPAFFAPFFINFAEFTKFKNFSEIIQYLTDDLLNKIPKMNKLLEIFPSDTLIWKFTCLKEGCEYMDNAGYNNVQQRTLILTGDQDIMVPSNTEGPRLEKILPRAKNIRFKDRAHVILQDKDIDLTNLIRKNNFYITARKMTSFPELNARQGNQYGVMAGPIEVPSLRELEEDKQRISFEEMKKIFSPVFFSTDCNGEVVQGLENLPKGEQILLVGNHQPLPLDFIFIVEKIFKERGVLFRSLTHPFAFQPDNFAKDTQILKTMLKYGVVPVSPNNLYKLLNLGESVMLLPGGVTEAIKSQKNKYQLIWPKNPEFVRMAAKFGVTIVPFSSIGLEDSYVEVFSAEEVQKLPIIGDLIKQNSLEIFGSQKPRAWQGVTDQSPPYVPQIVVPSVPQRLYIKFGRPIRTENSWVEDKQKCAEIHKYIKNSVEEGISYFEFQRKNDPYKDFVLRSLYEATWNYKKQAPTFIP